MYGLFITNNIPIKDSVDILSIFLSKKKLKYSDIINIIALINEGEFPSIADYIKIIVDKTFNL